MLAAMARPSRRFGGPRARCADEQGFPSWTRPGDRPSAQRSNNRPLMWNCGRQWRTARVTLAVLRFFGVIVPTITRGLYTPAVPTGLRY